MHLESYGGLTLLPIVDDDSATRRPVGNVIAATMYLLVAGRGLLLPFVLALALWYMVDALADTIERPGFANLHLPRPLALIAAFLVMGGLVWVVGRTVGRNISAVAAAAPAYEGRLQKLVDQGAALIGIEHAPTVSELFDRISLADTQSGLATAAASVVSVAGIVLVYTGFLSSSRSISARSPSCCAGSAGQVRSVLIDHRDIRIYLASRRRRPWRPQPGLRVMAWVGVISRPLGRHGVLLLYTQPRFDPGHRGAVAAYARAVRPSGPLPDRALVIGTSGS